MGADRAVGAVEAAMLFGSKHRGFRRSHKKH